MAPALTHKSTRPTDRDLLRGHRLLLAAKSCHSRLLGVQRSRGGARTNLESKLLLEKLTKTRFLRGLPSDSVEKEEAKGIGMGVSRIAIDCTEVPRLSLQKQKNSGHRDKMLEWCRTIMIGLQQELDKLSQEAT